MQRAADVVEWNVFMNVQSSSSFLIHFQPIVHKILTAQPVLQPIFNKKGLVEKVYFSELRNLKESLKKVLSPGFKLLLKTQRLFLNGKP